MDTPRSIIFVDGENLCARFQAMKEAGRKPKPSVVHETDAYAWDGTIAKYSDWSLLRVSYYTTIVGDDVRLKAVAEALSTTRYDYSKGFGYLNPHIFKKQSRGDKTKSVDINLVTDFLRHSYNGSIDEACVLTGDGDFLPAIEEAMRQGIRVFTGAFSSGLDERIRIYGDEFIDLDNLYFEPLDASNTPQITTPVSNRNTACQ